jgi:hypothetical protein
MARLYFSAARPANPIAGIFKSAGNVEILSWGRGLKVRASVSVPNQSIEVASNWRTEDWVRRNVKNHFCPVQKIFAPLCKKILQRATSQKI